MRTFEIIFTTQTAKGEKIATDRNQSDEIVAETQELAIKSLCEKLREQDGDVLIFINTINEL